MPRTASAQDSNQTTAGDAAGNADAPAPASPVIEFAGPDLDGRVAKGISLIEFYTNRTRPTHRILEEVSAAVGPSVLVGRVNLSPLAARPLVTRYGVKNVPAFMVIKDGDIAFETVGAAPASEYIAQIRALLAPAPAEPAPVVPPPVTSPAGRTVTQTQKASPNVSVSVSNTNTAGNYAGAGRSSVTRNNTISQRVERTPNFLHIGGGSYEYRPREGGGVANFGGTSLGFGLTSFHNEFGQVRWDFDVGFFFHGSYRYTDRYYDRYQFDLATLIPITLAPTFEVNLGTPALRLRAGPLIGLTYVNFSEGYGDDYHSGERYTRDQSGVSFTWGGTAGITWTPLDRFYFDLSYRFEANPSARMSGSSAGAQHIHWRGHRIEGAFGWRF